MSIVNMPLNYSSSWDENRFGLVAAAIMTIGLEGGGAGRMPVWRIYQYGIFDSREKAYKGFKYDLAARPMKSASMEPQRARVYEARAR